MKRNSKGRLRDVTLRVAIESPDDYGTALARSTLSGDVRVVWALNMVRTEW